MERLKLGEIESEFEVFARPNGFNMTLEICEIDGVTNRYNNLLDFANDVFIYNGMLGYYRLEAITKALLQGKKVELHDYEKEVLL